MINDLLAEGVVAGIAKLYGESAALSAVQIQDTKKEFEGDLTVVVFQLLKASKKGPAETAEELGQYLLDNCDPVESYNVVKGFLNLVITNSFWLEAMATYIEDDNFGISTTRTGKKYMVEYASPNTNKPLHLGHLRNIFLGDAVANILDANGHTVLRTQIFPKSFVT